jgi:hypothetical protein
MLSTTPYLPTPCETDYDTIPSNSCFLQADVVADAQQQMGLSSVIISLA